MKLLRYAILLCTSLFLIISCGDDNTPTEAALEPLEFTTEPSTELSQLIETAPGNYTWAYFNDNITVSAVPVAIWSGEIVLSSFQVENCEVVNRINSSPVETIIGEFADGLSTKELFPGSE